MTNTPKLLLLLLTFLLAEGAFAAEPSQIIKIAGIFDLSGTGKVWGNAEHNGFNLAISDFKAANREFSVEAKVEDSEYSNSKSVSAFQKLTAVDEISMIVGPTWETFVAVMPLCESNQIVCFAPSNNSKEFERQDLIYSFSAYFDERGYTSVIADEIKERGLTKVGVVANISAYHDPIVDNLLARLGSAPIIIERVLPDQRDFKSIIPSIPVDLDALVVLLLGDGQLAAFLQQFHSMKRSVSVIYTDDAPIYDTITAQLKELRLPIRYSKQYLNPVAERNWKEKYKVRFGVEPESPSAAVAYDETMMMLRCAALNPEPEAVSKCVRSIQGYDGQSGKLSFGGKQAVTTRSYRVYDF